MPTGAYHAAGNGEGFNGGWTEMAFVAVKLSRWPLALRIDGTYAANGANDVLKRDLTAAFGVPTDEKTKVVGANLDVTYPITSGARASPYLLGGVGIYHVTISVTSSGSTAENAETRFAWNVGGGLVYRIGGAALFVEARQVSAGAVSGFPATTFLPITAGVRIGAH
jgi:opacity protein-like surface antigen